jgi:hypothetical protein
MKTYGVWEHPNGKRFAIQDVVEQEDDFNAADFYVAEGTPVRIGEFEVDDSDELLDDYFCVQRD